MKRSYGAPSGYFVTESDDPSVWEDDWCDELTELDVLIEILKRLQ